MKKPVPNMPTHDARSGGLTRLLVGRVRREHELQRLAALAALANAVPTDCRRLATAIDAMAPLHWTARDVERNLTAVQEARELAREVQATLHGWSVQFHPGKGRGGVGQHRPTYDEAGEAARVAAALITVNRRIASLRSAEPRVPVVQQGALLWTGADETNPLVYVAEVVAEIATDPRRVHRCLKVDCGTFLFDSRPVIRGTGKSYCDVRHAALARDALARQSDRSAKPGGSNPPLRRLRSKR